MSEKFDAVVVGSGFGGSITACRLAEQGMKVLVLERGRRWTATDTRASRAIPGPTTSAGPRSVMVGSTCAFSRG